MSTPLFTKTFDFVTWALSITNHFPRNQRFVVTKRLSDAVLNFQEIIIDANSVRGRERLKKLIKADAELNKVRLYFRLAHKWKWLTSGQYKHAAYHHTEIGKLLGAWIKISKSK